MHKYETLFQGLENQDWVVADDVMPSGLTNQLYESAQNIWHQGKFRDANVGSRQAEIRDTEIRGDQIFWLDEHSPMQACRTFLIWATDLQQQLNRYFFLGLKRYEFHFARYDVGYGYKTHLDQHQNQPFRQITLILYLNPEWGDRDGGELCMFCLADHSKETQRIVPKHNRLVLFRSGQVPHAVRPCARPRWSLTGWFRNDDDVLAHRRT